jgi:hypothetical protein
MPVASFSGHRHGLGGGIDGAETVGGDVYSAGLDELVFVSSRIGQEVFG